MEYCVIQSTASNEEEAKTIAKHLVESKLIACCTIVPKVRSIYIWQNQLNDDEEVLMIMKTRTELYSKVEEEIKKLHSYEVPEIILLTVSAGNKDYLKWIDEQTI